MAKKADQAKPEAGEKAAAPAPEAAGEAPAKKERKEKRHRFFERLTVQISAWPKKAPEGGPAAPATGGAFGDTAAVR